MELLKEAKNVVDFATYYPLLNKATVDNDTPTPGYLFEEIIKLSHQSSGHRQHLVDFMLARLQISSWPGKQKVVRILHQVCSRGHFGVRIYLRGKDGELRKASSAGGPPDPVLANTPQLFLSSAIQELLTLLFDPKLMREDELKLAGKADGEEGLNSSAQQSLVGQGYGSSAPKGKYEGFGSSPLPRNENLVSQVRDIVERVMSPSGESKKEVDFLQSEKGDYQPLSLPSLGSSVSGPSQAALQPHLPILAKSHSAKYKAHRTGRAGGGWDSDEEATDMPPSPFASDMEMSMGTSDHHLSESQSIGMSEEEFLNIYIHDKVVWPVDHNELVKTCQECTSYNLTLLLEKVLHKLSEFAENKTLAEESSAVVKETAPLAGSLQTCRLLRLLLMVEFGIHYDVFSPAQVNNILGKMFQNLQGNENLESSVRLKSRKLSLILHKLV
ncbi:AP-4 complex accessory subunit Tepsin-like isoform X1 [Macrobrachium nipponense]|uniref:AP-4 complex accessory subunit Tepsin-like isoform X1 n=2 Tax=Macrobrachium nipponense TaxID=159736 RepID=UPI0030C8CB8B